MARSRYKVGGEGGGDDINVTPLMDIVFIMLIFFIVTSTFVKEPGVEIDRPEAQTAKVRKLASILIAVDAENKIWIDKDEVPIDTVRTVVQQLKQENPKGTAVVQVDRNADSRYLVEVLNQVKAAGIEDVAVSTEDPS
ncbi:MAG: biopolymer transporter ExbD [Parvularculaceae bacterium]|nr:biopolymer transporter ExbD [Parvularculaceae bacterium]